MARRGVGKIVNRGELCQIMGISSPTIDNWEKRGMPVQKKGGKGVANEYNTAEVIKWWASDEASPGASRATGEEAAKERKLTAEAGLAEIKLAEARGEVVPTDKAVKGFAKMTAAVRAKMLAIPTKLAPVVAVTTDIEMARAAIEEAVREALSELADGVVTVDEDSADA